MAVRLVPALVAAALMQPVHPPLRSIDRGPSSQIRTERLAVARDDAEWSRLWMAHAPSRPRPQVDFASEIVVAVFAGARPTAGFSVDIVGYREAAGALVVSYRETAPPSGSITAQVMTSPYAIATIPQRPGDVSFEKSEQ